MLAGENATTATTTILIIIHHYSNYSYKYNWIKKKLENELNDIDFFLKDDEMEQDVEQISTCLFFLVHVQRLN